MRRRGLTVLLGALLTLLLGWQIGRADVPYVALGPGPTVNTLGAVDGSGDVCTDPATPAPAPSSSPGSSPSPTPSPEPECQLVIQITGSSTSDSKGQLRMVTVSVQSGMTLLEAIRGWISDEDAVVPRKLIYPENKTEQEVEQENKEEFQNSQTSAETAALRFLGYPVKVAVGRVTAGGAAEGKLQPDDIIKSVDGVAVTTPQSLLDLVRQKPAGTTLRMGYERAGADSTVDVVSKASDDGTPRIGVEIKTVQPRPFELRIKLDKIGGPSAGMMFALGIIDKIKPEDMTHGKVIAGTGTIDDEGRVGPIGGVPQKLIGAKDDGAEIFLVPAGNCEEAKANAVEGLTLVKVATLDEAVKALDALGTGGQLPPC